MKNKSIYLIILLALGSLASCSKSNPPVTPEKPIVTEPPKTETPTKTDPPRSTTKLLPIKIESSGQSVAFKYLGETNSLLSIDNANGKKILITYKDNQMNGLMSFEGDKLYYVDYVRDSKNHINQVNQWNQTKDDDIPLGYYKIEYNEQQQMTQINYYSPTNKLLRTKTFSYDLSNDQMGILIETNGTETTKYTFDQKNGLFKNVADAQLLAIETGDRFFLSADHNLLSIAGTLTNNDLICSYEYNADAYPTLINWLALNVNMTFKVTYKSF